LWSQIGGLTEARDDWAGAVAHWAEALRRFPPPLTEAERLHKALLRLADIDPAAASVAVQQTLFLRSDHDTVNSNNPASLKKLALSFESLGGAGGAGGCEFGTVQRYWGSEALGLLRWATVTPTSLIAGLNARFEGIEDQQTLEIFPAVDGGLDVWEINDRRYGFCMHSFVPVSEVSRERMFISAQKRMKYLRDKLITDLENPTKVFVLKIADRPLTHEDAQAIRQGLRSYGPGEILCVCSADAQYPQGVIEARAPGLWVGFIDFLGLIELDARMPAWLAICQAVLNSVRTRA
jgi:hypothetical protein